MHLKLCVLFSFDDVTSARFLREVLGVHACAQSGLNVLACTVSRMMKNEAAERGLGLGWAAVLGVNEISAMFPGSDTSM